MGGRRRLSWDSERSSKREGFREEVWGGERREERYSIVVSEGGRGVIVVWKGDGAQGVRSGVVRIHADVCK